MKVGVIGSREFRNFAQMKEYLDGYLSTDDELVSGGAKEGGDAGAYTYARDEGYPIDVRFPRKKKYGIPAAYFIRNTEIAERSDVVIAFYSKNRFQIGGTWDTVQKATKLGKEVIEIKEI